MPPRVVVLAIDGMDPGAVERDVARGWMPTVGELIRRSRAVRLQTFGELFPTSVWPCAVSGVAVEHHGLHAFAAPRSGALDFVEAADFALPTPFWETAVRAGLRASVADVPFYGPPPAAAGLAGLTFLEWGPHPTVRGPGSFPPALAPAIVARHGTHPFPNDDQAITTAAGLTGIRDSLCEGVRRRGRVLADLLDDGPDLLVAVFPEPHVAGHQFLNLSDPKHPCHDPAVAAAVGDSPIRHVQEAVDAEIAALVRRLPPETIVLLTFMLGVRVTYGGSQLLGDLLVRMGLTVPAAGPRRRATSLFRAIVPAPIRAAIRRRLPPDLVDREARGRFRSTIDWKTTRAFALPWAYEGYLRLNVRGREPLGVVEPGAERDALLTQIEETLRGLRVAGSGEPAVTEMVRAQEQFAGRASAELPDLMVFWRNRERIDAVECPVCGRIVNRDPGPRSEHSSAAALFACGDGIAPGGPIDIRRDVDLAPTVLALLGVTPPGELDGRAIPGLATAGAAAV